MCKHKPLCFLICLLLFVGGLNWGLIGLGGFLGGKNLNVVNLLLGTWPAVESVVYLLVGVAALFFGFFTVTAKSCGCQTSSGGGM